MIKTDINILDKNVSKDNIDVKFISDNLENIFTCTWNSEIFNNQILNENNILIISKDIVNNIITGFICIKIVLDEMEILNIAVNVNYRNMKIGSNLLNFTLNYANTNNCKTANLEVNINNKFAIKLYQNLGFNIIHTRKDYYLNQVTGTKEDAYIMSKNL